MPRTKVAFIVTAPNNDAKVRFRFACFFLLAKIRLEINSEAFEANGVMRKEM